jgi:hypothetical protein
VYFAVGLLIAAIAGAGYGVVAARMQSRKQRGPLLGVTLLALFLSASLAGHFWMVVLVGAAVIVADFIVSMTVP